MKVTDASLGVDQTIRKLADRMELEIDSLVETMLARMHDEVPEFDVDARPELLDALRASCYGNTRAGLTALRSDRATPSAMPPEALAEALATARSGTPLEALLHTYRVGHAVAWEHFVDLVEELELPGSSRQAVLRIGSRYLFAYTDAVAGMVTEEYTRERDRLLRSSIQRRAQLVGDVLRGAWVSAAELAYDLDAEHLGVVVEGAEADAEFHRLTEGMGGETVTVAAGERVLWGWLGGHRLGNAELRRFAAFEALPDTVIGTGEPGSGAEGFRETHAQALAALRVGERLGRALTRYDDVALEAIALGNESNARRLVARELGPLLSAERGPKLRETLEAYLGASMNASAAGAALGVNDRTIAYRLRQVEEILGRTVPSRSAELAVALRLSRLFN